MDDITLVKASLQAGLQLYGRPNPSYGESNWTYQKEWCKLFNIDYTKYENKWVDSGLIWDWSALPKIYRQTFTQNAIYQCYCVGFNDFEECKGNCFLDDVYTFLPDGTGFDSYSPFGKEQRYNNTIAYYWDCSITELFMDIKTEDEFNKWLKNILASKKRIKEYEKRAKRFEEIQSKIY